MLNLSSRKYVHVSEITESPRKMPEIKSGSISLHISLYCSKFKIFQGSSVYYVCFISSIKHYINLSFTY